MSGRSSGLPVRSTAPRERPILFSAPMVRALLAGSKTQTRRIVKPAPRPIRIADCDSFMWGPGKHASTTDRAEWLCACPYGAPGDRLWVRETWAESDSGPDYYAADYDSKEQAGVLRWRPSIFMKRASSRITLEVTGVRVERLQDISEDDARAEGVDPEEWWTVWKEETRAAVDVNVAPEDGRFLSHERQSNRDAYGRLWDAINGERAPWVSNPWVWIVEFKRAEVKAA